MISVTELKKMMPVPDKCPFCGTELSPDNAEIEHIIPLSMGGTDDPENLRYVCRKCNAIRSDKHSHLLAYYLRLMKNKGMENDTSAMKIDYILRNMSDNDMEILEERVGEKDAAYGRLSAYFRYLSENNIYSLPNDAQPDSDELAQEMNKTIKAYDNYDIDDEERIFINGNTFTYKKGFPIEQYSDILESYGKDEQGEIYSVYVDDEGRLVVY